MKSISIQYGELKEGKMDKFQFLRNARMMFPSFVTNQNSFEDSVKILKNRGLLTESEAVKGVPDKEPVYTYPEKVKKYKKVENGPEIAEQDGVYPATTLNDIPKEKADKKIKSKADGLEPIKDNDTKNEMKKVKPLKEETGKTYSLFLADSVIYDDLDIKKLKSILNALETQLGEDLNDYIVLQNETNHTKSADKLGWDLSNAEPFNNVEALKKKIYSINNGLKESKVDDIKVGDVVKHKSTGAEFKVTKISGSTVEGKYTKLGKMEGKAKLGDINKTNINLIGKTYELLKESKVDPSYFSDKQIVALAKKVAEFSSDAKEDLIDLAISGGYMGVPKDAVKHILAQYDIQISDLKESKKT